MSRGRSARGCGPSAQLQGGRVCALTARIHLRRCPPRFSQTVPLSVIAKGFCHSPPSSCGSAQRTPGVQKHLAAAHLQPPRIDHHCAVTEGGLFAADAREEPRLQAAAYCGFHAPFIRPESGRFFSCVLVNRAIFDRALCFTASDSAPA